MVIGKCCEALDLENYNSGHLNVFNLLLLLGNHMPGKIGINVFLCHAV